MKGGQLTGRWLCARALGLLAALLLAVPSAWSGLLVLTQAQATVVVQGLDTKIHQGLTLPYIWDIDNNGPSGDGYGEFDLRFDLATVPDEPWGLYLPSAGNAYAVWLNGTLLDRHGDLLHGNGADHAKVPHFVVITPGLLHTENKIRVYIRADAGRRAGLSELVLGPQDEVYAAYMSTYRWRSTGSLVVVAFSLAVGFLAFVLWLTQSDPTLAGAPQGDRLYLYAALAELCWTLAVGDALIDNPPLPWPWWSALPAAAAAAWACFMQLFCIEVAGWRRSDAARWFSRWLLMLTGLSFVLPLWAAGWGAPWLLALWHGVMAVTFLGFGSVFLWRAMRPVVGAHCIVALALGINLLVGMRDLYVFRITPAFPDNSLLRFSSLFFGLSLAYIVIMRFRSASAQARDLTATLVSRVAHKESELADSYRQMEILAREQERTAERARILRDMHDGVGSHISSAIRQMQSYQEVNRRAGHAEVLLTLRDALDQLKLSIDAIHLPPGDITSLLANLRYRLEPRLAASGIVLQWNVDLLPIIARLDASAMRQVQFMLFEALSNVVQHAQARVLFIDAHAECPATPSADSGVRIRVVDDGRGFDVQSTRRQGLASMQERASAIGAQLSINSHPGQTVIEIRLG